MGVQQGAEKRKGRPGRPRAAQCRPRGICKWEEQEVKELSSLIFGYVQGNGGKLPTLKSDAAFWAFCCERFQGRFTARQVHDKAHSLKLRFRQLSSGLAKSIKLSQRDIFHLWTRIMNINQSPQVINDNAGNGEGGQPEKSSHPAAINRPSTEIPCDRVAGTTGSNDMEDPSKGKTPRAGGDKGGVGAAGEAYATVEEGHDASTCSTEKVFGESQYSHHGDYGTYTKHADDDVHATPNVGESAHNMTLFQHLIVADLAAATKNLAEFVHSHGKQATAN